MFWLLIVILFSGDGTKAIQTSVEPTEQACQAKADEVLATVKADKPPELIGLGLKCDGPMNDPSVDTKDATK